MLCPKCNMLELCIAEREGEKTIYRCPDARCGYFCQQMTGKTALLGVHANQQQKGGDKWTNKEC